jgi:hypothetical protein
VVAEQQVLWLLSSTLEKLADAGAMVWATGKASSSSHTK